MPQQPIDYTMRYQIRSGRVNFADYVQRRQLVEDGVLLGLSLYPPSNDASIVQNIEEGATNTTPAEYAEYLEQVAQEENPTATVPAAPTNLVATPGNTQATITFTAGSDGGSPITNYEYITDGSGAVFEPFDPPVTSSPVIVTNLPNGQLRRIRLRAVNAIGPGPESEIVEVTPVGPPSTPYGLNATVGISSVEINFSQGSNGGRPITNYQYSINNGTSYTLFSPAQTVSPVIITGLSASTLYQIKIKAVNNIGSSDGSDTLSITTNTGPTAPTITYALPDNGAAYIYFDVGTNGGSTITNYEYSVNSGTFTAFSPTDTSSPVKITGLTNNTLYSVSLRSVTSGAGNSDASNIVTVTPSAAVTQTATLNYDPSNVSSYSGTGTALYNIGSYGSMTGTLRGAVTYNGAVKGGVLDFTGANGTYITFPTINFGTQITVCAWVYPRLKNDISGLLTNAGANVATNGIKFQWNWWLNSSRTIGIQAGNGSAGGDYYAPQNTLTYDTWQHLSYVFDKTNAKILVFLNGVPTTMATSTNTIPNINLNAAFNIGGYTGGSYTMNAQLGSIKVYSGALTASDILAEYDATKSRFL